MSFHYSIDGGSALAPPVTGSLLPLRHEDLLSGISRGFPSPARMRGWSARGGRRRRQRKPINGFRSGGGWNNMSLSGTSILLQPDGDDGGGQLDGCHSLLYDSLEEHRRFRNQQRSFLEERELDIARAITRTPNRRGDHLTKASIDDHQKHYLAGGNYTLSSSVGKQSRILTSSFRPRSAAARTSARPGRRSRRNRDPARDYLRSDPFSSVKFPERTQLMMRRELRKREERRLLELRKRMDFSGDERAALHPQLYSRGEI